MECRGRVRVDRRTKDLIPRLKPGEIALICHEDLDEVSAQGLIAARVRAVVNAAESMSGRYPNRGPLLVVQAGIPLVDGFSPELLDRVTEGELLILKGPDLFRGNEWLGSGVLREEEELEEKLAALHANLHNRIDDFIENTLAYAYREKGLLGEIDIPDLDCEMRGKDVVVVVRGQGYRQDLAALRAYIHESRPVLVGVDGGADALREAGFTPDLIVGDMDSVSDETLRSAPEILVHAYRDGRAPGLSRVRSLGLPAKVIRARGTSEDVALWVAYKKGARLIVAVGTHSNAVDFLEKGRKGMASTFLVRLVVGPILFDAKGVSRLYGSHEKSLYRGLGQLAVAAAVPLLLITLLSTPLRRLLTLLWLRIRVFAGW